MGGAVTKIARGKSSTFEADTSGSVHIEKRWVEDRKFSAENSLVYAHSPLYAELRNTLEDPLGQHYLGNFANAESSHENFFAWIDMEEYKGIPTKDYRRFTAKNIFQKYIKEGAVMHLGVLTPERINYYQLAIYGPQHANRNNSNPSAEENSSDNDTIRLTQMPGRLDLPPDLFMGLQHAIFREMAENTFKRFQASAQYKEYEKRKKETYNRVDVDDFEYLEFLGQGAFGLVARVRKKSTNKEYAIKVMSKAKLIRSMGRRGGYKVRKARICMERNVYVNSTFPFIVEMHYAFQTNMDALIVMEFARGGTVHDLKHQYNDKQMPEDHVKFVIAELMLALRHLHCINYVHRDLKPINVLLDEHGHIKLTDMGLVGHIDDDKGVLQRPTREELLEREQDSGSDLSDAEGERSKDALESESLIEVKKEDSNGDIEAPLEHSLEDGHHHIKKTGSKRQVGHVGRRFTRVGTMGYKAPELLQAKRPHKRKTTKKNKKDDSSDDKSALQDTAANQKTTVNGQPESSLVDRDVESEPEGYGASVDWWSLGVMTLEMLCGKNHYAPSGLAVLQGGEMEKVELGVITSMQNPSSKLPSNVSEECKRFVDGLLEKEPKLRLGTNEAGFRGLCQHEWFKDIDMSKLLAKEVEPPYKVLNMGKAHINKPKWVNYASMKAEVDMEGLSTLMGSIDDCHIPDKYQRFFDDWDYVAQTTFKLELGAQNERLEKEREGLQFPDEAPVVEATKATTGDAEEPTSAKDIKPITPRD